MRPVPHFSTREPGSERPRLLLVSYHFPPRESAGALRWRKLAPYLHEAGWDLDVICTPPQGAGDRDGGLSDLPPGVELYSVQGGPGRLRRFEDGLARWIRSRRKARNQPVSIPGGESSQVERMIPSSRLSWTPHSFRDLIRVYHVLLQHEETWAWAAKARRVGDMLASRTRYRGVIGSAPPWGVLLAASSLATRHSLPHILDFRDPWSLPRPYLTESDAHPLGFVLAERAEASAIRHASAVIMNTPTAERAMVDRYPSTRFCTILNGIDDVYLNEQVDSTETFRIVYAGSIYIDRDPRPLFRAVGTLVERLDLAPGDLEVEFIGEASHFSGVPTERLAAEAGIQDYFRLVPPMSRASLMDRLRKAAVLVSLPQSTPWSIPSKVYEYLGFSAQLMVFTSPGSGTAEVLRDSDAIVLEPFDHDGTVSALQDCYLAHRAGTSTRDPEYVARFARERRGRELQDLLCEIGLVADASE